MNRKLSKQWAGWSLFMYTMVGVGILPVQGQEGRVIRFQTESPQQYTVSWQDKEYRANEQGLVQITGVGVGIQQFRFELLPGKHYFHHQLEVGPADLFLSLRFTTEGEWMLFNPITFQTQAMTLGGIKERKLPVPPIAAPEPLGVGRDQVPVAVGQVIKAAAPKLAARPLPIVTCIYEKAGAEGVDMVFEIRDQDLRDTVVLFVPRLTYPVKGQEARQKGNLYKRPILAARHVYYTAQINKP